MNKTDPFRHFSLLSQLDFLVLAVNFSSSGQSWGRDGFGQNPWQNIPNDQDYLCYNSPWESFATCGGACSWPIYQHQCHDNDQTPVRIFILWRAVFRAFFPLPVQHQLRSWFATNVLVHNKGCLFTYQSLLGAGDGWGTLSIPFLMDSPVRENSLFPVLDMFLLSLETAAQLRECTGRSWGTCLPTPLCSWQFFTCSADLSR